MTRQHAPYISSSPVVSLSQAWISYPFAASNTTGNKQFVPSTTVSRYILYFAWFLAMVFRALPFLNHSI